MKSTFLFLLSIATAMQIAACGNNTKEAATTQNGTEVIKPTVTNPDMKVYRQVADIYNQYLLIQTALAGDQPIAAGAAAARLTMITGNFKDTALSSQQLQAYEAHVAGIKQGAAKIESSKDIEQQRLAFEPLSEHIFQLLKIFGSDKPAYQIHCPMAFDNKGASWLSDKQTIRNPYYGDKMLECGALVAIVKR